MSQWMKMAEEQGEVVRKLKEDVKADPARKDDLDQAVAKLKELKAKADDPMNALEDPITKGKYDLVRSVGEECVTDGELAMLMARKPDSFILYDGFEPSGRMHIAQGIFKAMNVNKCTRAGGTFVFWVADWFALMNDKMGGDLEKIKTVGKYLVQVWTASGMDMERVKFIWSSDEISNNAVAYWTQALDIARRTTIARVKKCCQIMGRLENKLTAAQILYPLMQATDIFFLKADICQLGVDQRKVNMLAREYCDSAGIKNKPIILSHHMLYGLKKGQEKMSKSDPDSAIFMEDTPEDVARKLGNAYCPATAEEDDKKAVAEGEEIDAGLESMHLVENDLKNPCLDYVEHIIFSVPDQVFKCGGVDYKAFADVREAFMGGKLDEATLKAALVDAVNNPKEVATKVKSIAERASESVDPHLLNKMRKETEKLTQSAEKLTSQAGAVLNSPEAAKETVSKLAGWMQQASDPEVAYHVAEAVNKALKVAELIITEEKYRGIATVDAPLVIMRLLSLLENVRSIEAKKLALRMIGCLSQSMESRLEICRLDGYRKVLRVLHDSPDHLGKEALTILSHLIEAHDSEAAAGGTDAPPRLKQMLETATTRTKAHGLTVPDFNHSTIWSTAKALVAEVGDEALANPIDSKRWLL